MKLLIFAVILLLSAASNISAGEMPDVREGMWEITTQVNMPGMQMSASTHRQCLTQNQFVPQDPQNQNCQVLDVKTTGTTVTWTMKCSEQGSQVEGNGSIAYSGESFSGTFAMKVADPSGKKMTMNSTLTGRRVGNCK